MLKASNIMVYKNPSNPEFVTVSVHAQTHKNNKVHIKQFHITDEQIPKFEAMIWQAILADKWICYPFMFESGGTGFHIARKNFW